MDNNQPYNNVFGNWVTPYWLQGQLPADHDSSSSSGNKLNTVTLKVYLCCDGCEDKWKDELVDYVEGFKEVDVDRTLHKVTVRGTKDMKASQVLKAIKKHQKRVEIWAHKGSATA